MNELIKGYKVTDKDGKCRGFQYEVGKSYKHAGEIGLCNSGFHFCIIPNHCFNYYEFDPANRVFEIEAAGDIIHSDDKSVCNHITFMRELKWEEVLTLVNIGKNNTGHSNTGDSNTGNSNTGNRNTGYSNTGYSNTGDWNTGYSNTGDWNTGNRNTGDSNTGNRNTGNRNTGNRNTGDWNTGDWNTGYSNTGNRNTGVFCTGVNKIFMFNAPSEWTIEDFINSDAYRLMCSSVNTKMWVNQSQMTEKEKEKFPSYKTAEGYLKDIPFKEAFQNAWHNWNENSRKAFTMLPNFNSKIFEEITGVRV